MKEIKRPLGKLPLCWSDENNWEEWNKLNNFLASTMRNHQHECYCTDCLPEFKLARQREGRCEHVGVHFVRIVEQRFDAKLNRRIDVTTDALRGVRPKV